MTKLAGVVKAGQSYEIDLITGAALLILPATAKGSVLLEKVDDNEQLLYLQTVVPTGRNKGVKARTLIPYSAIVKIICA